MSGYSEHLISMAGGDGEADVLGEIEARTTPKQGGWESVQDRDIRTLLAMVREQRAVIGRVRELCDSIPRGLALDGGEPSDADYALFGFSNTIRAALTTPEQS